MKFPCRAFRSALAKLQQFIVDPQQLLEGIVVDHHGGAVYVTFSWWPSSRKSPDIILKFFEAIVILELRSCIHDGFKAILQIRW
jgi:hypothetical protein